MKKKLYHYEVKHIGNIPLSLVLKGSPEIDATLQGCKKSFQLPASGNFDDLSSETGISTSSLHDVVDGKSVLAFNTETNKYEILFNVMAKQTTEQESPKKVLVKTDENDPVIKQILEASNIKPDDLEIEEIKWKILIRSVLRGKNVMLTGPAGCGKTQAAKALEKALKRPLFYFNLGATQDPRSVLIGNTHLVNSETIFNRSAFVQAITTKNAIVLIDELTRAHPEAWNILMSVLDEGQRYLRLDEEIDSPIIKVAEGVSFIATANMGNEYTATRVIDRAIHDRFQVIEIDVLTYDRELSLLTRRYPELDAKMAQMVANVTAMTRSEWEKEDSRISTMISTRMSTNVCELLLDKFTIQEAMEVGVYPFFDATGGPDSERTFVKQLVQRFKE